jgi:antitoxin component of RelBE/YafQ-DinJ toxin-antitoxin module
MKRSLISVRVDAEILNALQAIKARDGIPVNEQIRRGVLLWLAQKQALPPAPKPKKG